MGVIHKGGREKGMAEWGSYTRVAERKGYGWLNGVTHKNDRGIEVRLAEWGHTFKDDREKGYG